MKNVILLFLVLSSLSFGQISPTEFPKIGFADLYWLKVAPSCTTSSSIDYSSYNYFYPELKTLGLTHVVTMGDAIPFNTGYNPGIKILDNNFGYLNSRIYLPAAYATGQGNDPSSLPYEAGGNGYSVLENEKHNCGFGTQALSSRWIRFDNTAHPLVGKHDYRDNEKYVHYASISSDPAGTILWADLDPGHQSKDPSGR